MRVDFFDYRKWFNKMFSLFYAGKFFGLGKLLELGIFELFVHKLNKLLNRSVKMRPLGDVIVMCIHGVIIKLYDR